MRNRTFILASAAVALLTFASAAFAQSNGRSGWHVPPGFRPPARYCRVWISGVPPGHQPAVTTCARAFATVPANGRVLVGGRGFRAGDRYYQSRYYWWDNNVERWVLNPVWYELAKIQPRTIQKKEWDRRKWDHKKSDKHKHTYKHKTEGKRK